MNLNQFRRLLYQLASLLGDLNAIQRGTIGKRIVRKAAQKQSNKLLNKLFK